MAEEDSQNRTGRMVQQNKTGRTGMPERTARTGLQEQGCLDRAASTGLLGKDRQGTIII